MIKPGAQAPDFSAETAHHGAFSLDSLSDQTVLLQFYRFAGCPVCNMSLRNYVQRFAALEAADIHVVAVFHSSVKSLREHVEVKDIPFPLVADPDKLAYKLYGVEDSPRAMAAPAVLGKAVRAIARGYFPKPAEGGQNGLPADFLLERGVVRYAHYGKHAADTLSVAEVLKLGRSLFETPRAR